ncbi:hypothetical protein Ahy_B01g056694 [Arachis hypogaea]|uniref:Uncharacterized protein n=1 Tax=Arachis hypogaea TaxID=3818 RepID=A0A445AZB6_ARAHY|nr:hypothetical protein Ahy_B01g056694 [Arachis hypogaea]
MHQAFDNAMAEMQEYQTKSKGKSSLSYEEATLSHVNDLQSPPRGGSMIQLSSSLYDAQDMNYPGEDYRSFRLLIFDKYLESIHCEPRTKQQPRRFQEIYTLTLDFH